MTPMDVDVLYFYGLYDKPIIRNLLLILFNVFLGWEASFRFNSGSPALIVYKRGTMRATLLLGLSIIMSVFLFCYIVHNLTWWAVCSVVGA